MLTQLLENHIFIQGIGLIAFALFVASFQSNVRHRMLYLQMSAMSLLGIHLYLLGALTGAAMMSVLVVRNIVFAQKERLLWAARREVLYVTFFAVTAVGLWSWQGWGSLFAILGSLCATAGFWSTRPKLIRRITLVSVFLWIPYTVIFKSYPMLLLQIFLLGSITIAMWRYDRVRADI